MTATKQIWPMVPDFDEVVSDAASEEAQRAVGGEYLPEPLH